VCNLQPTSQDYVRLTTPDPEAHPAILNYLTTPDDQYPATVARARRPIATAHTKLSAGARNRGAIVAKHGTAVKRHVGRLGRTPMVLRGAGLGSKPRRGPTRRASTGGGP
jgi:hypothetical protein